MGQVGEEATERLAQAMPNLLLSPRAHMVFAFIADKTGDEKTAEVEQLVAAACCEGILATGDGTKANPYLVVRTSDERDVMHYLDRQFKQQSLVEDGDRHLDLIECEDGSEMWFDITDAYAKLGESLGD